MTPQDSRSDARVLVMQIYQVTRRILQIAAVEAMTLQLPVPQVAWLTTATSRATVRIRMHTPMMYAITFHLFLRALIYTRRNPLEPPSLPVPLPLLQTTH